ncbi:unnamed protein product [Paramecium pentaurelia]|uniref:Uncharacterized protein n=1 Tax=Paramecium pentaurelia TaxID=43138 RepID=A0A8S1SSU7_9CILI|nr:unnamed protein product [Paramecium pentaurelia]
MQEELSYNPEIMKSQLGMLPPIEQFTLQQLANKRKVNFNMMLSLPFLLKDKQLEDRKDTIAIYRKRKFEPLQPQKHNIPLINSGRIHCTELWSDKYQTTALRDSHIEKNLNKYKQIIKTNIQEYLIKFEIQAKEQLEEARNIKYSEIYKKQPSISEDDFVPTQNELNVSLCTQDEIFNFYKEPKKYNVTQLQKTSLRNLDKITNSSLKQSYIDKFDKVISVCDRYSINSNRNSMDYINTIGYGNIKKKKRNIIDIKTSSSHIN